MNYPIFDKDFSEAIIPGIKFSETSLIYFLGLFEESP
jgi:hypothetical protein